MARGKMGTLLLIGAVACGGSTRADAGEVAGNDPCSARSIDFYCRKDGVQCPRSPRDIPAACELVDQTTSRGATACGGSVVNVERKGSTEHYYFDASDHLVGFVGTSDDGVACGDDGLGPAYGKVCEPQGGAVELCNSACQLGSLSDYCSQPGRDCPTSLDTAAIRCDAESDSYRYANACGGVNLLVVVVGARGWSFDGEGRLIGASGGYDSEHFCDGTATTGVYGKFCKATDDGEDLCTDR